jgi:hypothetical protein
MDVYLTLRVLRGAFEIVTVLAKQRFDRVKVISRLSSMLDSVAL